MFGAICGDVIGRPFEFDHPSTTKDFELFSEGSRFSDDTVLTMAVARATIDGTPYWNALVDYGLAYKDTGFAGNFTTWLANPSQGRGVMRCNGAAMRVSPVAWLARDMAHTLSLAMESAKPTHDTHEGISGALAVAAAVRLAIEGASKDEIRRHVTVLTGYDLTRTVDQIRADYPRFKWRASESVPEAIICALEANSVEDAIRNAVSLGNDADTQAGIAAAIAEPMFGIPAEILARALETLSREFRAATDRFLEATSRFRSGAGDPVTRAAR